MPAEPARGAAEIRGTKALSPHVRGPVMEVGIHVASFNYPGGTSTTAPELTRLAQAAEAAGATWLSVMDHYFQIDRIGPADDPMLEGYTTLGFLAAHTSTITLGLLVTGVTYRHPGLLVKVVSTLDVLSGGRAALGIGAAWYEREHRGLGVPFPRTAERFERLEETLQICLQMWDPADNGGFEGRHYRLDETLCSPAPMSRPHPPIVVGGRGEKKTLRLVAQYADACNLLPGSTAEIAHKLDVLRRHCDDVGRDYETLRTTMLYNGSSLRTGDVDTFVREMADYADLGIGSVMVMPVPDRPATWIDQVCAPAVTRLADH
jgi:F420-dependent oxidoreductase-like protein